MKTIILAALLLTLALVYVQAMPEDAHRLRGADLLNQSTSSVSKSGGSGMCWVSSKCEDNCKRDGHYSGYCFFFRCYCSDEKP
ncbi:uncharacterized protein LOC117649986 [Thrips palmi]|uniref:Uncharacterized protein LOC117649986 n=1 Tax=Thrips palmi TaxID=161013 RepID=A0A6P8ZUX0_THRPL|nr:uncharacterized protein LOC117649986 [Thrips palmi]